MIRKSWFIIIICLMYGTMWCTRVNINGCDISYFTDQGKPFIFQLQNKNIPTVNVFYAEKQPLVHARPYWCNKTNIIMNKKDIIITTGMFNNVPCNNEEIDFLDAIKVATRELCIPTKQCSILQDPDTLLFTYEKLAAERINFVAQELVFNHCVFNTKEISIESSVPNSLIREIIIRMANNERPVDGSVPLHYCNGVIDFDAKNPHIHLAIENIDQMEILFNDRAFRSCSRKRRRIVNKS